MWEIFLHCCFWLKVYIVTEGMAQVKDINILLLKFLQHGCIFINEVTLRMVDLNGDILKYKKVVRRLV